LQNIKLIIANQPILEFNRMLAQIRGFLEHLVGKQDLLYSAKEGKQVG
jgi:hypothetical protein